MSFYERLQSLAKENNKSFSQIEKDLGYSKNSLYHYKTKMPTANNITRLSDYFNVSTDYLLEKEPQNPEFSVIQRRAKKLTPEQQRELINLMERAFDKLDKGELHLDEDDDF